LASARLLATELHRRRAFGDDIALDHKRKKREQAEASANTFGSLVTDFLSQHAAKTRSLKQTARVLGVMPNGEAIKRGLYAEWGGDSTRYLKSRGGSCTIFGAQWLLIAQSWASRSTRSNSY
jgi:hypothetical protein